MSRLKSIGSAAGAGNAATETTNQANGKMKIRVRGGCCIGGTPGQGGFKAGLHSIQNNRRIPPAPCWFESYGPAIQVGSGERDRCFGATRRRLRFVEL